MSGKDYSALILQLLAPWDVWRVKSGQFRARCCFHLGDNRTSFSVFDSGRYHCFRCNASGDIVRLVMKLTRLSLKGAQDYLGKVPTPFRSAADVKPLPPWEQRSGVKLRTTNYAVLNEAMLGPYRKYCPNYLINRGFSQAVLKRYEVGYDHEHSKIVIPVRDWQGKLVGLTYRKDFDDDKTQISKYWHDNFDKSYHMYGFHMWAGKEIEELCLVEGQLDVIRLSQLGIPAAAVMGDEMSDHQVRVIQQHCKANHLTMAFDNDEAGLGASQNTMSKLIKTRFGPSLQIMYFPPGVKDPGELREYHQVRRHPSTVLLTRPRNHDIVTIVSQKGIH